MAELPRFFATQPTPRIGPSRTARTTAPLQRLTPGTFAQEGRAAAGIGQAIAGIGQVVEQIDAKFAQARAVSDGDAATAAFLDQAQTTFAEQLAQPRVDPEAFRDALQAEKARIGDTLGPLARARFEPKVTTAIFGLSSQLIAEDRRRIIRQGQTTFSQNVQTFQSQLSGSNPETWGDLETVFRAEQAAYVAVGSITEQQLDLAVSGALNASLQLANRRQPTIMMEAYADKNQLTFLTDAQRVALIDDAETEADQALQRQAAKDREDIRQRTVMSMNTRATLIDQMIIADDNVEMLAGLMDEARIMARDGRMLLGKDFEATQRFGQSQITNAENELRTVTDPRTLQEYFRTLMLEEDPQDAINFAIGHAGSGIGVGSLPGLLSTAATAKDARHFRNLFETKDAIAFLNGQLSTTGDPILDTLVNVGMNANRSAAITDMLVQIQAVAGPDGLNKDAVLEAIPAIRDRVTATYQSRLKSILNSENAAPVGQPQTSSIRDLARQWLFMLQQGVPKHEADAFLGRELARHTALAAPEDRTLNTQALAAELEQALREFQEQKAP